MSLERPQRACHAFLHGVSNTVREDLLLMGQDDVLSANRHRVDGDRGDNVDSVGRDE